MVFLRRSSQFLLLIGVPDPIASSIPWLLGLIHGNGAFLTLDQRCWLYKLHQITISFPYDFLVLYIPAPIVFIMICIELTLYTILYPLLMFQYFFRCWNHPNVSADVMYLLDITQVLESKHPLSSSVNYPAKEVEKPGTPLQGPRDVLT